MPPLYTPPAYIWREFFASKYMVVGAIATAAISAASLYMGSTRRAVPFSFTAWPEGVVATRASLQVPVKVSIPLV